MKRRKYVFRWWHLPLWWLIATQFVIFYTFWRFDWCIQPAVLQSRPGSDGYVASSLGSWGLDYLQKGEEVPSWNPYICGGMPTEGSLLFTTRNPMGHAAMALQGYRADWEVSSRPIRFTWRNWLGNSLQIYFGPVGLCLIPVVAIYYLVIS